MMNNPKILVYEQERQREDNRKEIEQQFEEEKNHFRTITSMIEKAKRNEENEEVHRELMILQGKIEHTRQLHDRFAKLVIQNISYEMKLKVENPSLFWENSLVSFREQIYEQWLLKEGVKDFSVVEKILSPLFSPKNEFVLPLDWIWGEQELPETGLLDEITDEEETEDWQHRRITNWRSVVDAWSYVFSHLLKEGSFSLADLAGLPKEVQDEWFEESETLDLWMMFDKKPLKVQVSERKEETITDERELLLHKLIASYPQFSVLEGMKLYTEFDHKADPILWYRTKISPFKLCIVEETE